MGGAVPGLGEAWASGLVVIFEGKGQIVNF